MGSGSTDPSGGENVRSGNDDRAEQLESSTSGGGLPDFEEFDPDDAEEAAAGPSATPTAGTATDEEGPDFDALLEEAEGVAAVEAEDEPDDTGPDADSGDGGAGDAGTDRTGTGEPTVDPEAVLTEMGDRDAFTAEELQDEATAQAFADWINENVRRANVGEEYVDQVRRLAADDLDADVPEHLDLDRGVEYTPMLSADDPSGASEVSMWVVQTDDGEELYVTLDTSQTAGDTLESAAVVDEVSDAIGEAGEPEAARPSFPAVAVDEAREASVMESVGAADAGPVSRYRGGGDDHSAADYRAAIAGKVLVGDTDLGGNVVTSSDGQFHPIDFDLAGADLARKDERVADADTGINESHDGLWDKVTHRANTNTRYFDYEYDRDEVTAHTRALAASIDPDALAERLADTPNVSRRVGETVTDNVRALRRGEL